MISYTLIQNQLRDLKEKVRQQGKIITQLANSRSSATAPPRADESDPKIRLSPTSIKKHRTRLKLSQGQLGALLKVNINTIVRWEAGTSMPRARHRAQLAQLRTMGIRQVKEELEA